jgi:hypothetical protein
MRMVLKKYAKLIKTQNLGILSVLSLLSHRVVLVCTQSMEYCPKRANGEDACNNSKGEHRNDKRQS